MKRYVIFAFALVMLLLCACQNSNVGQTDPSETAVPTQTTTQTETTAPTQTTAQTETTVAMPTETEPEETTEPVVVEYNLDVDDWLVNEPGYLSYTEYFSKDREYGFVDGTSWLIMDGDAGYRYYVQRMDEGIAVVSESTGEMYLVPNSAGYSEFNIIGADGRYAYLQNNKEIGRMDLVTGEYAATFSCEEIVDSRTYDGMVTYYIAYCADDGEASYQVGRIYLPTGDNMELHSFGAENVLQSTVSFRYIYSTRGLVRWTMINPDFVSVLENELSNPDSGFVNYHYDNSEYWEAENGVQLLFECQYYMLIDAIEDANDVFAYRMGVYDADTGKYSEQGGIMDSCWYGSGGSHDHFDPVFRDNGDPIYVKERWFSVKEKVNFAVSGQNEDYVDGRFTLCADYTGTPYLYFALDGVYKKVTEIPVKGIRDTGEYLLCITTDNRILAVSYDGKETALLYKSVYGEVTNLDVEDNYAAFSDGDYIVLIDLENQKYREVVYHPDLFSFYMSRVYDKGVYLDEYEIYFEVCSGLYIQGYTLNLMTGEVHEGYRL